MKIIAPYAYFAPEQAASSYLWKNLHESFAAAGFECELLVPTPTRGISYEVYREYANKKMVETFYDGKLVVKRFGLWREPKGAGKRFIRYSVQCVKQYFIISRKKKQKQFDLIFAVSTPPIIGVTCALIKKRLGIPFVYNLQDIFPDSLAGTGLAKKGGLLWKIGRMIEDFTYRHADKIIVISEDFKKNIMAKGVPEDKIVVVYNWVDQNAVVDIPRADNKLFKMYGIDPDKFYIEYSGNIGLTQNMDMLLEVMREFKEKADNPEIRAEEREMYNNIGLVLVGDGAYRKHVEEMVKREGLDNVIMLPFQPYEDISHVFSLGDAGLVISKPGVGANSVPSKTWSIMSASRPVLANFDENEMKSILEENGCGIFTKAGDKEAFKEAILKLYQNKDLCKRYGHNGRQFVMENLTKEVGTQKYVDVIRSVVEKR